MVLVMEYAAGGELYDYLSERKVLAEAEARRIFRQIATAVYYCHKHKICHRDLKLENILLDEHGNAKIADFGLSNVFDETRLLNTFCGSPLYASPEIVRGTPYHGPEVDCWSLGVLLYTLVYGAMPFDGSNFKRLVKQISQGDYFEPKRPSPASPLIRAILTVNPRRRADIEAICSHWWVNEGYEGSSDVPSCLEEAEELASRTPVRLDLLLSLVPPPAPGGGPLVVGEAAVAPVDGAEPAVEAAVTGVQEIGNGDVVCQPVPPRSHSVGSFMDLEYHGTPSRMPPFVPPERRPKAGGRVSEKEAPQKRKLEGGGASGVCVPKRIDEEGRKEEEEERLASMSVSGVLKEEEEEEVKTEEEPIPDKDVVPPTVATEVESMEVDEVSESVPVASEPKKDEVVEVAEVKSDERTVSETAVEEKVEEVPQPEVQMAEAVKSEQNEVKGVSMTESEVVTEAKPEEVPEGVTDQSEAMRLEEEEKKRLALEEEEKKKEVEEEERKKAEDEKRTKEDEEKKAAKALARKRLSLKIPKKAPAATQPVPDAAPAPPVAEVSKVSDAKRAFEKKATNVSAVIKVNNKPVPPSATSKVPPSPSQSKTEIVSPGAKKKNEESPKKESTPKPSKDTPKEPKESSTPSIVNDNKENEKVPAPIKESAQPAEKTVKDVRSSSAEKVAPEKSPVENKVDKVQKPKEADKTPAAKKSSVKPKETVEPVNKTAVSPKAEVDQVKKTPENVAVNSVVKADESPLVENPPVWAKSATLPRRTGLRGVPTPYGQKQAQFINSTQPPQPKPQEPVIQEQQIPQSAPAQVPSQAQSNTTPRQYSTAVEYTIKPEIQGFPGELSFTISQGMPNSGGISNTELQPPPEPAPQVKRVGRPITRHPTAPATFLRSSSLGPTPRSTAAPPSRGVERIIPIQVERDEESEAANSFSRSTSQTTTDDVSTSTTTSTRPPLYPQGQPHLGPRGEVLSRQSTQESDSGDTATPGSQAPTPGPEPIRKSPREFIIPIAVEGGGYVTPRAGSLEPSGQEERQNSADPWQQFHARAGRLGRPKRMSASMRSESGGASEDEGNSLSSPPPTFNGHPFEDEAASTASTTSTTPSVPKPFHMHRLRSSRPNRRLLEHSDSFSSAEEEDDDDGFEILTAESLFSTLLARVRSLTQRLNVDDGSGSGVSMSNRSSHLFPSAGRLLSGGLHHHTGMHHLGSLGSAAASSPLSGGSLFSSSFRSPHNQTSSSGLWSNLHNSRAGESLSRRLSEASRFSDPTRYSRSMSGGGISPGGFSTTSSANSATPWRRNLNRDTSLDGGDKSSPGSWRSTDGRGDDSVASSGSPLGTFVARVPPGSSVRVTLHVPVGGRLSASGGPGGGAMRVGISTRGYPRGASTDPSSPSTPTSNTLPRPRSTIAGGTSY
ncbi:hypothetical protein J437_LFUL012487 [Ladona fulva]|uniref:Protein kinase domain-containing protein n=1 Tax=Ladona fulva TaxID=123851 RepID=A0A8K0KF42_LADFU|nr:hypothetical protein J437_LFUL012487 [Ladona fulva]